MIKINEDERRDFFRIDDNVYIDFEIISEEEYKLAPSTLESLNDSSFNLSANFATLNNNINPVLNNIKQLHPEIGAFLDMINGKIDDLSQHILQNNSNYDESKTINANLSASGIQFKSSQILKPQQPIKLELILLPEKIGVLVFGRVVDTKDGLTSIVFEHLRPEDQELMIKHNLNKQMTTLREKNDFN